MKSSTRQLINTAFGALEVLNNVRMTPYRTQLFDLCLAEERDSRGGRVGKEFDATPSECARMFCVRTIATFLLNPSRVPSVSDYLHILPSRFLAAALVLNYRPLIEAALKDFNLSELAALDYRELDKRD